MTTPSGDSETPSAGAAGKQAAAVDCGPLLMGTTACHTEAELAGKLAQERPLRVKLGVDPSSADLHIGHAVPLRYLRRLQQMGHRPVLIIGDATAQVGDPTGRNATRPQLTAAQVEANAQTYLQQAGLILDLEGCDVVRNSEWFDSMSFMDAVALGSFTTVARMLERDTFDVRFKAGVPIGMHEFLYPLMQARDSVEVRADIEIGGTDQTFNLLFGRDLMRSVDMEPQICITLPILPGLDGVQKMSKSLGNAVGLTDAPRDMFGKLMSIPDAQMPEYYSLCTELDPQAQAQAQAGSPRDAKAELARLVTSLYHGEAAGDAASEEFNRIFRDKGLPDEIPQSVLPAKLVEAEGAWIVRILTEVGLAASGSAARRLIKEGGVRIDGQRLTDEQARLPAGSEVLLQVGKRRFHKLTVP